MPGGPGRLITMIESALETKTNTKTRLRDIDPAIIRAQCAADPVKMAREIVRAKIEAGLKFTLKGSRREAMLGGGMARKTEWRPELSLKS